MALMPPHKAQKFFLFKALTPQASNAFFESRGNNFFYECLEQSLSSQARSTFLKAEALLSK